MDTNSHYGHLSVRDGRSLRVAKNFLVKPVGEDASPFFSADKPNVSHMMPNINNYHTIQQQEAAN
jgi:hypothetical protein